MITSDSILTPAAREFIAQWYDGSQYIKAPHLRLDRRA